MRVPSTHTQPDVIRDDARYRVLSDDTRRDVFDDFMIDRKAALIDAFKGLLKKTNLITYKTELDSKEFKELKRDLLMTDMRWRALDDLPEEREAIIQQHLEKLKETHAKMAHEASLENEEMADIKFA